MAFSFPNWNARGPIDIYMRDDGNFNQHVAHRRWILFSKATDMGIATSTRFNSMFVVDGFSNPSVYEDFIAYPPRGYMPQTLVPARWSFSIPNADFSNATITMQDPDGNVVPLTVSSRNITFYGDNTLVWEPSNIITDSNQDESYTITISNVGNAVESSYTYTSTIVPISYPPLCSIGLEWQEDLCACGEGTSICPTEPVEIITSSERCTRMPINFLVNVAGAKYSYDFGDDRAPWNR